MLDLLVKNGRAVTPHGTGAWDVAVQGERIVAVTPPGTFTEAARTIDASGMVVVPGGVEPHTHLAHRISMHPDEELFTLGPEDDSRGMAFGGTTTHVDFCFVRPGGDLPTAIEQRVARWRGQSHIDYSFHVTLVGALPLKTFDALPEAIQQGFPSFKVFTTDILPPHPRRPFRRTINLANAIGGAVYFVHTSAKEGVEAVAEARGHGKPIYAETLHHYACFTADDYRTPRGYCYHTYPSLKFAEDRDALWDGLLGDAVSTTATDEFPTSLDLKLRGKTIEDVTGGNLGAEARMGIVYTEGVAKRGMALDRFVDVTSANAAKILGLYPRKGALAPGSDADIVLIDPAVVRPLAKTDFHVSDYSPWEGWSVKGWPVTTILRGKVIVERGMLHGSLDDGRLVTRKIDPVMLRRPGC